MLTYISQFLYPTLSYGAAEVAQQFQTDLPNVDFMTTFEDWLAVQNGQAPFPQRHLDPVRRYIRNGRDIESYVHVDILFEAYLNACLYLIDLGAPLDPGNPYLNTPNQSGFGTFGAPHIKALVAEVSTRALKAVWYQSEYAPSRSRLINQAPTATAPGGTHAAARPSRNGRLASARPQAAPGSPAPLGIARLSIAKSSRTPPTFS